MFSYCLFFCEMSQRWLYYLWILYMSLPWRENFTLPWKYIYNIDNNIDYWILCMYFLRPNARKSRLFNLNKKTCPNYWVTSSLLYQIIGPPLFYARLLGGAPPSISDYRAVLLFYTRLLGGVLLLYQIIGRYPLQN